MTGSANTPGQYRYLIVVIIVPAAATTVVIPIIVIIIVMIVVPVAGTAVVVPIITVVVKSQVVGDPSAASELKLKVYQRAHHDIAPYLRHADVERPPTDNHEIGPNLGDDTLNFDFIEIICIDISIKFDFTGNPNPIGGEGDIRLGKTADHHAALNDGVAHVDSLIANHQHAVLQAFDHAFDLELIGRLW